MSIPVALADLAASMVRFGTAPYLISVGPDGAPHAASVTVEWSDGKLVAGAGRHTVANVRENSSVALLWPPPEPGDYTLIVDGPGEVQEMGPHLVVVIEPRTAIYHATVPGFSESAGAS